MQFFKRLFLHKPSLFCFGLSLLYLLRRRLWRIGPQKLMRAVVVYRALQRKHGAESYVITYTDAIVVMLPDVVVKLTLTPQTQNDMRHAYENYRALRRTKMAEFLAYKLKPVADDMYVMSRLDVAGEVDIRPILAAVRSTSDVRGAVEVGVLIDAVTKAYPETVKLADMVNSRFRWNVGGMHGDLSPRNILRNRDGRVAVIDLDRYTQSGFPDFDEMHYAMEKEAKLRKVRFFTVLNEWIARAETLHELQACIAYFVYRLRLEMREGVAVSSVDVRAVRLSVNAFVARAQALQGVS